VYPADSTKKRNALPLPPVAKATINWGLFAGLRAPRFHRSAVVHVGWCEEHAGASPSGRQREPFEAQGKQAPALHMRPGLSARGRGGQRGFYVWQWVRKIESGAICAARRHRREVLRLRLARLTRAGPVSTTMAKANLNGGALRGPEGPRFHQI
jgi:hypothetical protein